MKKEPTGCGACARAWGKSQSRMKAFETSHTFRKTEEKNAMHKLHFTDAKQNLQIF